MKNSSCVWHMIYMSISIILCCSVLKIFRLLFSILELFLSMTSSRFNYKATKLVVEIWLDCFSNELKLFQHANAMPARNPDLLTHTLATQYKQGEEKTRIEAN